MGINTIDVEYCTKFKIEVKNIYNLNGCIGCSISNDYKNCIYKRLRNNYGNN